MLIIVLLSIQHGYKDPLTSVSLSIFENGLTKFLNTLQASPLLALSQVFTSIGEQSFYLGLFCYPIVFYFKYRERDILFRTL